MTVAVSLSGFPEWLPAGQLVEQHVVASLRRTFELHGFSPLETRAVEPLDSLLQKGETDKEIYVLRRLHAGADDPDSGLGLHFDLTVPFARYVRENAGRLHFPFRRYQIQRAWRGERPQEGRYREFLQADVDVVGRGGLAPHFEAELPLVAGEALARLPIPPVSVHVNNRKVIEGVLRAVGLGEQAGEALHVIDRLPRVGEQAVEALLEELGATSEQARTCLAVTSICRDDLSFAEEVRRLGLSDPLMDEGLEELVSVMEAAAESRPGLCLADLSITRGLDYYTGTVYETLMEGHEALGSVCSGGRYDDLVGAGEASYPGVGLSIGVTRILAPLLGRGRITSSRSVPTCVLVAVPDEQRRAGSERVAGRLRSRGIPTEVSPDAARYGRQIRYADQRGIPFVWFPGQDGQDEVRDIRSGVQVEADAASWEPPSFDLTVGVAALP